MAALWPGQMLQRQLRKKCSGEPRGKAVARGEEALARPSEPPSLSTRSFNLEQGYLRSPEATSKAQTLDLRR